MASLVIAIPARNEADRIGACLAAIAAQPGVAQHVAGIVVYANNCTDATVAQARAAGQHHMLPVEICDIKLPAEQAHIGWARHGAMSAAAALLDRAAVRGGAIVATDADSRVQPGWLAEIVAEFRNGADAIAGSIDLDPLDVGISVPIRSLESRYAAATAKLVACIDPLPHDPWPNHIWAWGANLAVRADTLSAIGGMPIVELAEDRALHALLLRHDARVRHSLVARVWTSARIDGRAPGGFADLLSDYRANPATLCDIALEPAAATARRAATRARLRRCHAAGDWSRITRLATILGATVPDHAPTFGILWEAVEASSPLLARQRIQLAALPQQIAAMEHRLATLKRSTGAGRCDIGG